MKILLLFDNDLDQSRLTAALKKCGPAEIVIFSLLGDPLVLDAVCEKIKVGGEFSVTIRNSAQIIGGYVAMLRKRICKWSADIGDQVVASKTIKEWFMLPGCGVSAWWLGLISEKSTLKTDAYFRTAQVHAIDELIAAEKPDLCLFSIVDRRLFRSVSDIAAARRLPLRTISPRFSFSLNDCRPTFLRFLERFGWAGGFVRGLVAWSRMVARACAARKGLPPFTRRCAPSNPFLFVSYFPAVDKEAAGRGVFRNKYAPFLQDKLKAKDIPITWLLMPEPLNGCDFNEAVRLAALFSRNGEKMFILEEFLTFRIALKGFVLWLRQIVIAVFLFGRIEKRRLTAEPVGPHCDRIVRSLWDTSFCGSVAVNSILYALIFREVFVRIPDIADCLYFCEMHAWEKALNAAKKDISPRTRTIGHQHSSVSRNDMGHFYDRSETVRTGKPSDLPLPDIIACNGKYLCDLLSESGYPNLVETEAIRYLYLNEVLARPPAPRKGRPLLLVAGPCNRNEAKSLAGLVAAAFPASDRFDIWFKGHPAMPFEEIFRELGLNGSDSGFIIKHGNIDEYLGKAWAVLVPTSTVALEALGSGCDVIIPVFPDVMLMNPLADFNKYYHAVTTPLELRAVMDKIAAGSSLCRIEEYSGFLRGYWNLDSALPLWSRLLAERNSY